MTTTSTLQMKNADYARNTSGAKSLKGNLQGDLEKIATQLTKCSEYTTFLNIVNNNWIGDDEVKFVKRFKNEVKDMQEAIRNYKTKIETLLGDDAKQFSQYQSDNAATIDSSLTKGTY